MSLPGNVEVRSALPREHDGYSLEDERAIQALSRAEDQHFWHLSRNRFIADRLARLSARAPRRIVDLGCGGGCVAAHLARLGYAVTGVDGHLPRVLEAAARAPDATFIVEDLSVDGALADQAGADVVGLFDVIEHLDDPRRALERALRLARPEGVVVGTVPALMALWSDADRLAGHRLRYDLPRLEALLRSVPGARLVEAFPFNRMIVPLLWFQRRAESGAESAASAERFLRVPWAPLNRALYLLLRLEHRLDAVLPRRVPGASIWFAIRKQG
jgi:SAM-dependent methyltransferase